MTRYRCKVKGRRESGSFIAVPHAVLENEHYANLSFKARSLLFDLLSQFRGSNNGDLSMEWKKMLKKGWKSKGTLYTARDELENSGFIIRTRQGGKHQCSLYGVTWLAIDECNGKLDRDPTRTAPGYWKTGGNPELN